MHSISINPFILLLIVLKEIVKE